MDKTLKYKLRNETKGSCRYEAVEEATGIGDLYIRKEVLEKPFPKMLTVTIKAE